MKPLSHKVNGETDFGLGFVHVLNHFPWFCKVHIKPHLMYNPSGGCWQQRGLRNHPAAHGDLTAIVVVAVEGRPSS